MKTIPTLLFTLVLSNCSPLVTSEKEIFRFFDELIGEWYLEGEETIEIWKKDKYGNYSASVYEFSGNDTSLVERIRILEKEEIFYYEATVINQNNSEPIRFEIKKVSDNKAVFENLQHDFPQQIIYHIRNKKMLNATIRGKVDGKEKSINFTYQKK